MSTAQPQPQPHDHLRIEAAREGVTMALYQSLSLLAVLIATPSPDADSANITVAVTVFLTGLGLLFAHHVAFRLSTRLVNHGVLSPESLRLLAAQTKGGMPVVVGAAIPPLLFGAEVGTTISEILLLALVVLVGYRAVRQAVERRQALLYLVGLTVTIVALMAVKTAVGH